MILKLSMNDSKRIYFLYSFAVNSNPWFWFFSHSCFHLLPSFSLRKFQDKFFILHNFQIMYFILSRSMSVFCKRLWTKESLFIFSGFFYSDVLIFEFCWLSVATGCYVKCHIRVFLLSKEEALPFLTSWSYINKYLSKSEMYCL